MLDYMLGKKLLDKYGISTVESAYVSSAAEAVKFANRGRIVLKVISNEAVHKSKAGLVKLNLQSPEDIKNAYAHLDKKGRDLAPYKMLAQKMAAGGVEIIIGGNLDSQFGKVLLLGLGGIYVETFKDVQLKLCPITKNDALDMISELKSANVITYNGKATEMVVSLLLKTSKLLSENADVRELDLNPVIIREGSYDAVDIRIIT